MDIPHTHLDAAALDLAGLAQDSTQPRETLVPCLWCMTLTRNQAACCNTHWEPPAAIARNVIDLR